MTTCTICGKHKKRGKYFCSTTCQGIWSSKNRRGVNAPYFKNNKVKCFICYKQFFSPPSAKRKFCLRKCWRKYQDTILAKKRLGKGTPNWKGTKVSYRTLHNWVVKHRGKPVKCENPNCEKRSDKYQWANKSRKYKRDLSDWIQLCIPCHRQYDMNSKGMLGARKKWRIYANKRERDSLGRFLL